MIFGKIRKNFSVKPHTFFLKSVYKSAVRYSFSARPGVNFGLRKPTETPLFLFTPRIGMRPSMQERFSGKPFFGLSTPSEALCIA